MLDPELESESSLAPPPLAEADLMQAKDENPKSIEAFRDEKTATIRMLVQERSDLARRIGYEGRNGRNPYCRMTSFTRSHADEVEAMLPFFRLMDQAFERTAPQFHAAQLALAQRIPEWVLRGTSFTGVQVNINWQTALHLDAGNYGPAVMTALTDGWFDGAVLCFPQHRLGVNLRMGNLMVANTQCEWHGNTSLWGVPSEFLRISFVGFFRLALLRCGRMADEEERRERFLRTLKW